MSTPLNTDAIAADIDRLLTERNTLAAQVTAVKALHRKYIYPGGRVVCRHCDWDFPIGENKWPCATRAALGEVPE